LLQGVCRVWKLELLTSVLSPWQGGRQNNAAEVTIKERYRHMQASRDPLAG